MLLMIGVRTKKMKKRIIIKAKRFINTLLKKDVYIDNESDLKFILALNLKV
jgi:hypothetical protein